MPAAPIHHTAIDSSKPWNGPAAEKAFDKKPADMVKFYAWVDTGQVDPDADGADKEDGALPHHDIGSDGSPGAANLAGVHAAVAALNGAQGGSRIPTSDKAGVLAHLNAHLVDAGVAEKDLPELKSAEAPSGRKPRQHRELERSPEYRRMSSRVLAGVGGAAIEIRDASSSGSGLVEVTGTVIVYGVPYTVNDPWGSFTETIHFGAVTDVLANPDLDCRFLLNHKGLPLARTGAPASLVLTDTQTGLNVTAQIDPRMTEASNLIVALEQRLLTQMSVGMCVDPEGDIWSGSDDYGMPNVRNIVKLSDVFDVSAVTYPASPTTSIDLAQRMWAEMPVESRERTRRLWTFARDARRGRNLSPADADALMHALERMHDVDERNAPTKVDAKVTDLIGQAKDAISAALTKQTTDPDNGTDPVDAQVMAGLAAAHTHLSQLLATQQVDGSPDPVQPSVPTTDSAGDYQEDPDGTSGAPNGDAPVPSNIDGTGARSLALELELLKLKRPRVAA